MRISQLSMNTLKRLAKKSGLQIDEKTGFLFGKKEGYDICLNGLDAYYKTLISFSVSYHDQYPNEQAFMQLVKDTKYLSSCHVSQYTVEFTILPGGTKWKREDRIADIMNKIVQFLKDNGYSNCCQSCGQKMDIDTYVINGNEQILCQSCFNSGVHTADRNQYQNRKKENMIAGIVGAFFGTLIGVCVIVGIGQMGYIASISGIIMGVCALKGYELLGGDLTKKGIVVSSIFLLFMVYIGYHANMAVTIMRYVHVDFFTAFERVTSKNFPLSEYKNDLIMLYVFTLVGALPVIWQAIRLKGCSKFTHKLG